MLKCRSWKPVSRPNFTFFYFISVVYKGYIYIFGGYNGLCDEHFNDLCRYSSGKFAVFMHIHSKVAWMWVLTLLCMAVCLHIATQEQLNRLTWHFIVGCFTFNFVDIFQFWLELDNNNFTWRPTCISQHILHITC